jgi:hypothetical protein
MTSTSSFITRLPLVLAGGYLVIATLVLIAACITDHDGGLWILHVYLSLPLSFIVSRLAKEVVPIAVLHEWPAKDFPLLSMLMIFSTMVLGPVMWYYIGKGLRLLLRPAANSDHSHRAT